MSHEKLSDVEHITRAVNTVIGICGVKEQRGIAALDGRDESVAYSQWSIDYGGVDDSTSRFKVDVREYLPGDLEDREFALLDPKLRDVIQIEVIDDTLSSTFGFVALSREGIVFESGFDVFEGPNHEVLDCESIAAELIRTANREYEYADSTLMNIAKHLKGIFEDAEFEAIIDGEDLERLQLDYPSEDYKKGTKLDMSMYKTDKGSLCVYIEEEYDDEHSSEYILVVSPDFGFSLQYYADSEDKKFVESAHVGRAVKEFDRLVRCFDIPI